MALGTATSRLLSSQRQVRMSASSDRMANKILCDLRTSGKGDEEHPGIRYCTHVTQVAGPQPSYAYIGVPVATWNYEEAPTTALISSGPAGKTRLRTRARVKYVNENGLTVDLLAGFIVKYDHSINEDSVVATVMDDRWLLSKVTVFGRATYDPETGRHYYEASQPAIFNRDGWQDCIDSPFGPRFAPTRRYGYGITADSQGLRNEPSPGAANKQARSWRARDIVAYLRAMHVPGGSKPYSPANYGITSLSTYLQWPTSFGSDPLFDRVPRGLDLENKTLLEALSLLCRRAGPFDIWIKPNGFHGQMRLVRCDIQRGGNYLYLPRYSDMTVDQALQDSNVVQGGHISESIVNYFDDVVICGDPPAVERMFATSRTNTSVQTPICLEPAWSSQEEAAFKALITANGDSKDAWQMACDRYPLVYSGYRFKSNPDDLPWPSDSKYGKMASQVRPRFLQQLLSSYSGGSSTNPRDWQRMPITVEYYDEVLETWKAAERFDGLEIAQDMSVLYFPGIRAKLQSCEHDAYLGTGFSARQMRMTCVASAYFRITGRAGPGSGNGTADPNHTDHRIHDNGAKFTFLAVAEPEDYVFWERDESHPVGTGVAEPNFSQNWPDQTGSYPLFSDQERLDRHARHRLSDVRRIEYSGNLTLQRWNPGIKPGDPIVVEGGGIVPWGVVRAVTWDADTQVQTVELMAADQSTVYDVPVGGAYATPQPSQQPPGKPTSDSPDIGYNEKKYEQEMAKSDSHFRANDVQSGARSSAQNVAPPEAPPEKGGSATNDKAAGKSGGAKTPWQSSAEWAKTAAARKAKENSARKQEWARKDAEGLAKLREQSAQRKAVMEQAQRTPPGRAIKPQPDASTEIINLIDSKAGPRAKPGAGSGRWEDEDE